MDEFSRRVVARVAVVSWTAITGQMAPRAEDVGDVFIAKRRESLVAACRREVLEETAHAFEPRALVGVYRWHYAAKDVTFLRFCFTGDAGEADAQRKLDKEIVRLHWLTPAELATRRSEHRSPLVAKCVADFLAGRRFPLELLSPEFA